MDKVFLTTNGDSVSAFESAEDALKPFLAEKSDWAVYLGDTDVVVPCTYENQPRILASLDAMGYLEFRQAGTRINSVPFTGDRRQQPREITR